MSSKKNKKQKLCRCGKPNKLNRSRYKECLKKENAYGKIRRQKRKGNGLCTTCQIRKPYKNFKRCLKCIKRVRKRRNKRRANKQCIECKTKSNTWYCKNCAPKRGGYNYAKYKKRSQYKKSNGICRDCPNKAVMGKIRCKLHQDKTNKCKREFVKKRRKSGICTRCGKIKTNNYYCKDCLDHKILNEITPRRLKIEQEKKINKKDIIAKTKGKCAYCGKKRRKMHMDHIIPISKGGRHIIDNLILACAKCNLSKHAKLLKDWKPNE